VTLDLTRLGGASACSPAVLDPAGGGGLAYGELRRLVDRWRHRLGRSGKALVAVASPRSRSGLIGYLGALGAGHAVVLVEDGGEGLWRWLIEAYRPDLIVADPGGAAARHAGRHGYRLDEGDGGVVPVWSRPPELGRDTRPIHPDLAMLIRTSGSLGRPKTVRLSFANLRANATAIAQALRIRPAARAMTSLPMDFSFGLSIVNSHLAAGASIALTTAPPSSAEFWWNLDQVRGTSVGAVPTTYRVLRSRRWDPRNHPSLHQLLHAGGALEETALLHFADLMARAGGELITMYGLTEATARVAYLPPQLLPEHPGSAGIPIPGGHIQIQRPDGTPAADGDTGEVVYKGPNVMMGYATSRADLSDGDAQHGLLHTGDLGHLDNGFLYLTGRADRQIKIFGRRIAPEQIELSLAADGITAAATPNGQDHLLIAIQGDGHNLPAHRQTIAEQLGLPPAALVVVELDELPRTSNGKIDYAGLRRRLRADREDVKA
jgi:long-chain acyl-CoA synthetase